MKVVLFLLLVAIVGVIGGSVYLAASVLDSEPMLAAMPVPDAADLGRMRELAQRADPRNLPAGALTQLSIPEHDLEQAFNYGLARYSREGRAHVDITDGMAHVQVSVRDPFDLGAWLNVDAELTESKSPALLHLQQLRIGSIPVPSSLANSVFVRAWQEFSQRYPQYAGMADFIDHYTFGNDELQVAYRWQPALLDELADRGRELLLSPDYQERLRAHYSRLAALTRVPALPQRASLTTLLVPMMQFAHERGGNAVEENRAALQVLAMYVMRVDGHKLLGLAGDPPVPIELRLSNRRDLAQHFLGSAGIAVTTDTALTQSIGELKEIEDTGAGGSGFSFTDLAVDRAGARVGELAVSSQANAEHVQQLLSGATLQEAEFMPDLVGLPEFMSAAEFNERFTEVGSAEYNAVAEEIERRVDALPILAPRSPYLQSSQPL